MAMQGVGYGLQPCFGLGKQPSLGQLLHLDLWCEQIEEGKARCQLRMARLVAANACGNTRPEGGFRQSVLLAQEQRQLCKVDEKDGVVEVVPHLVRLDGFHSRRRIALLEALRRYCAQATPLAAPGGLHLVVTLAPGSHEEQIARAARERGLAVAPLGAYFSGTPAMCGLVLGFATCPVALTGDAARRLAAAIRAG